MTASLRVLQGDCLELLPSLPQAALVYADPPYWCGRRLEDRAGSFEDGGTLDDYLARLLPRLHAAWDRVDERGCLVVQLDWHAAAYVRVELDRLLGMERFASEIVWRYRRWPAQTPNFQRVHDTLLRYVKTPGDSRWNQLYEPLAPSTVAATGGKKQRHQRRGGTWAQRAFGTVDEDSPGCAMGDVWEVPIVAGGAAERTGYPTQKPERLLERLILATTDPGDLVIDPYCGSGTTLAAAQRNARIAVGIDANPEAIAVATRRLGVAA